MGLFDFFSKDNKDSRAIGRWGKKLMNKYQQTGERKRAIEALTAIGTEEAVVQLLKRYEYRTEATILDEEEKELVHQSVLSLGDRAIPGLKQYINTQVYVYWPIKALRQIVGDHAAAGLVLEALEAVEDTFGTNQSRREQLVDNLRSVADDERVYKKLKELLEDDSEEIVIRAIDGLSARNDDPEVSLVVVPLVVNDATSVRVRTMILELIIEQQWNVKRFKKALTEKLPDAYFIDNTGVVRRR